MIEAIGLKFNAVSPCLSILYGILATCMKAKVASTATVAIIATPKSTSPHAMGSLKKLSFYLDDMHFIPAQVDRIPLNIEDEVNTEVCIGPYY